MAKGTTKEYFGADHEGATWWEHKGGLDSIRRSLQHRSGIVACLAAQTINDSKAIYNWTVLHDKETAYILDAEKYRSRIEVSNEIDLIQEAAEKGLNLKDILRSRGHWTF